MSKKNKKQQQEKHLTMLPTCTYVQLKLPTYLNNPSVDQIMLKHYLKAKVLQRKKLTIKQPLFITIFGKQVTVFLTQMHKFESQEKEESVTNQGQVLMVNAKTQISLFFEENGENGGDSEMMKKKGGEDYPIYGDLTLFENLKNMIVKNFEIREELCRVKLGPIKGVIIGGASGTGKTTYVNKIKSELSGKHKEIYCFKISSTQLLSRVVGGAEEYIRKIFKQLDNHRCSIFIIEDLHLLFGQKQISSHETALATLFSEMDSFKKPLMVIGTYNSERELSKSIYQSGRFQKQVILNLPNHHERIKILKQIFMNMGIDQNIDDQELKQFNLRLNGFSVGEIKQILKDAYILKGKAVNKNDLLAMLKEYRPAEIKELIVEVPEVYWEGIGGYQDVKKQIRKVTEFPLKFPEKFQLMNIQPSKGVLLYGPPGCSKTMMAKAIATESKLNFIGIKGPELFSKYVGESERAIRNLFRKARAFSPCIIFFDEIDALASQRTDQSDVTNRVLGQLLTEMDGVEGLKEVVIIAATNRPEVLDEALTRPGRFDHLIYIGPPNQEARKKIFQICLSSNQSINVETPISEPLETLAEELSIKTNRYTGAEITLICRQAALQALEQNIENPVVSRLNLQKAIHKIKNRLTEASICRYETFSLKYKNIEENQKQGGSGNPFGSHPFGKY